MCRCYLSPFKKKKKPGDLSHMRRAFQKKSYRQTGRQRQTSSQNNVLNELEIVANTFQPFKYLANTFANIMSTFKTDLWRKERQMDSQTDRQLNGETDGQINGQTGIHYEGWMDWPTDGQTDRQTVGWWDRLTNKAGYTAISCRRVGRGGYAHFPTFWLERDGWTNGPTDGQSLL